LPVPFAVNPEKGEYERSPIFQYRITEKTDHRANLKIVMVAAHGRNEASIIKIEKPISFEK